MTSISRRPMADLPIDVVDMLSLPAFIVTMLWEAKVLSRRELRTPGDMNHLTDDELAHAAEPVDRLVPVGYEPTDTRASLSMLVGNVAVNLAMAGVLGRINQRLFNRRIFTLKSDRAQIVVAMVVWDFLYYWNHRWQHEKRIFWANHVTHHSSEHYNLSTALRQPWSGYLLAWTFMPMPLLGIKPKHTAKAGQLNLLYQYWIHTEAIDRLPDLGEQILNTPSHHRVHHGANPQYLDKNYAGILIVWDKIFGTFEPEARRVKYGLTKNINSFKPLAIAYHEFSDIARDVIKARTWRERLGYIWRAPGWQPIDR